MKLLDTLSKAGYWILILVPSVFFIISIGSYFSVHTTFGEVPLTHNVLEDLAEAKRLPVIIFPVSWGAFLITLLAICYLICPFVLLINYFLHKQMNVRFHKRFSIAVVIVYVALFLLIRLEPIGWYLAYVMD